VKDQTVTRLRRKESQEWELAGCASQDGDREAAAKHTEKACEYARQLREYLAGLGE
jgi:hypothetical protein